MVVLLGMGSRLIHSGFPILDKYAGDALYAVLLYLILRMMRPQHSQSMHLILAAILVLAIELFQLTGIALEWRKNGSGLQKLISVPLGTKFGFWDLLAYTVGLAGIYGLDRFWISTRADSDG